MKFVGTSLDGNPIVELEAQDRADAMTAGAFFSRIPVIQLSEAEALRPVRTEG